MLDVFYNGRVNENDEAVLVEDGYITKIGDNEEVLMESIGASLHDLSTNRIIASKKVVGKDLLREDILKSMEILAAQGITSIATNLPYDRLGELEKVYEDGSAPIQTEVLIEVHSLEDIRRYDLQYKKDPWLKMGALFLTDTENVEEYVQTANEKKVSLLICTENEEEYRKLRGYQNKYHKVILEREVSEKKQMKVDDIASFAVVDNNGKVMMCVNEGYIVYRRGKGK